MKSFIPCWLPILLLVKTCLCTEAEIEVTPEDLYRIAVQRWKSRGTYHPWVDFATDIWQRFIDASASSNSHLELIGALEESILVIEKSTLHEGTNIERDQALANLYATYGRTLMKLTADECYRLAMDPHTLLIGSDKLDTTKPPSSKLCIENAENSLRNAVTLDATHKQANDLLQEVLGDDTVVHERKPQEFVAELFDSFADTFDDKLLKGLSYKVPELVGALARSARSSYQNALDAGCGTGLAGRFLRPLVSKTLVGVDASPKMLEIAGKCTLLQGCGLEATSTKKSENDKPLYEKLLVMDLENMTIANTLGSGEGFDLIVAADVFVYFGTLDVVLQTFAKISVPNAILVFSCERSTPEEAPLGYRLLPSGRFGHTKQHVQNAAQKVGYKELSYQEIVPRMEKGEEVRGFLFAFEFKPESKKKKSKHEDL